MPIIPITTPLSTADFALVKTKIADAKTLMVNILANLTPEENKGIFKANNNRYILIQKAIAYATNIPEIKPAFVTLATIANKKLVYDQLLETEGILASLLEGVREGKRLVGSQALTEGALPIYRGAQSAAVSNVPGAGQAADDMGTVFDLPDQPDGDEPDEPITP